MIKTCMLLMFGLMASAGFLSPKGLACNMVTSIDPITGTQYFDCEGNCNPGATCNWYAWSTTPPESSCECIDDEDDIDSLPVACKAILVNPSGGQWKTGTSIKCRNDNCEGHCQHFTPGAAWTEACTCF